MGSRTKKEAKATLRISSEALDPSEITETLQISPSRVHLKGERFSRNNANSVRRQECLWMLCSSTDAEYSLEDHIEELVNRVYPRKNNFLKLLEQCRSDIFCLYSLDDTINNTVILHRELLGRIAELHLELVFDLYAS